MDNQENAKKDEVFLEKGPNHLKPIQKTVMPDLQRRKVEDGFNQLRKTLVLVFLSFERNFKYLPEGDAHHSELFFISSGKNGKVPKILTMICSPTSG